MILLPYTPHYPEPEFDGEAFYEAVANLLETQYGETDVQSFDWLIDQWGQNGTPCHEVAADIYSYIVDQHLCPDCNCDNRVGNHQALRSGSYYEPSYHCTGERRQFTRK
jgi:hypothetical protein